jgi:hypothetical protein
MHLTLGGCYRAFGADMFNLCLKVREPSGCTKVRNQMKGSFRKASDSVTLERSLIIGGCLAYRLVDGRASRFEAKSLVFALNIAARRQRFGPSQGTKVSPQKIWVGLPLVTPNLTVNYNAPSQVEATKNRRVGENVYAREQCPLLER